MKYLALAALAAIVVAAGCSNEEPQVMLGGAPHVQADTKGKTFKVESLKSGKHVSLADFKGKVVLVDFWATWCGPCRSIMPTVDELYHRYKDKGFDVMAISAEDKPTVKKFVEAEGYSYPFYLDYAELASGTYKVDEIPRTLVFDREGKLVYDGVGADENGLATAVEKAMKTHADPPGI